MGDSVYSKDIINILKKAGFKDQQVNSKIVNVLLEALMDDEDKLLVGEANARVEAANRQLADVQNKFSEISAKIDSISTVISSVAESQKEYGSCVDDKAKDAIALFGSLLQMCQSLEKRETNGFVRGIELDPNDLVKNVSFVVYAYLGGGARQVIVPPDLKDKE